MSVMHKRNRYNFCNNTNRVKYTFKNISIKSASTSMGQIYLDFSASISQVYLISEKYIIFSV